MEREKVSLSVLILSSIGIFLFSSLIWTMPLFMKGWVPPAMMSDVLIRARNYHYIGRDVLSDGRDVLLSSKEVGEEGVPAVGANTLTVKLYALLFDAFGYDPRLPQAAAIILAAASLVMFHLTVYRLFNLKTALIFALLYVPAPIVGLWALAPGSYEFATFFFSCFIFFYLAFGSGTGRGLLAGAFFGLATLARNAFLIFTLPLAIYSLFVARSGLKRTVLLFLPVALIWGADGAHDYLTEGRVSNHYLQMTLNRFITRHQGVRFERYDGHFFPDPYTYHFKKDEFIEWAKRTREVDPTYLEIYTGVTDLRTQLRLYARSFLYYVRHLIQFDTFGGPLFLLFALLGSALLWRDRRELFYLFLLWPILILTVNVGLQTSNTDHFLEFAFPITALGALGLGGLSRSLSGLIAKGPSAPSQRPLAALFFFLVFLHLVLAWRVTLGESYRASRTEEVKRYAEAVKGVKLSDRGVVAVGGHPTFVYHLNYLTDRSCVYFDRKTIEGLISNGRLDEAFAFFDVEAVVGFDHPLSERVSELTGKRVLFAAP